MTVSAGRHAGASLSQCFVEKESGGLGDVEGIGLSPHGNPDREVRFLHPGFSQTILLGSHSDCDRGREISIVKIAGCMGRGGQDRDPLFPEPGQKQRRLGHGHGEGEDDASTGSNHVGVEEVRARIGHDDRIGASGVSGPDKCAKIAGFFNTFGHKEKGASRERDIFQFPTKLTCHGEKPFRPVAICHFGKDGGRTFEDFGSRGAAAFNEEGFIDAEEEGGTYEKRKRADAVLNGALNFAETFDDKKAGFIPGLSVPQANDLLDPWVLEAGQTHRNGVTKGAQGRWVI